MAAEYLKDAVDRREFVKSLNESRKPLGEVKSRELQSRQYRTSVPGAPDGQYVIFEQPDPKTGWDVWRVPLAGDRKPEPIIRTEANERGGWVSPDGRWIAFTSDVSGRDELYVQSYPVAGRRLQLTTTGIATFAIVDWSQDGREILVFDNAIRAIEIEAGVSIQAAAPRQLFAAPTGTVGFAAAADHKRFLIVEPVEEPEPAAIELDLNWAAALEKR